MRKNRPRILFLYPNEWDRQEIERAGLHQDFDIVFEGFDRYSILKRLHLALFDPLRFVDRMVEKYRGAIDGVVSNDDHWGALLAALVAKTLGLPGLDPQVLVTCQHKALFRQAERALFPDASPWFDVIEPGNATQKIATLPYPVFIKPVKSSFSVLAQHIDSEARMRRAIQFGAYERLSQTVALRSVGKLHRHVMGQSFQLPDIRSFIAETPLNGCQVNIDGFVQHGEITLLGVIDAVMYPGTHAFQRFEYPSQLPKAALDVLYQNTTALLKGLGYCHGFFNLEAFIEPTETPNTFRVRVIEVNPRMARQLTTLYQSVKGFDCWHALLSLACNLPVQHSEGGSMHCAASFVRRSFDGTLPTAPSPAQIAAVYQRFPKARLHLYMTPRGFGKVRELKWVGSYRYAVTNLAAASRQELFQDYEEIVNALGWESDYRSNDRTPCEAMTLGYVAQATAK
jgi:hypothetical protein